MLILAIILGIVAVVFAMLFTLQIIQNIQITRKLQELNDEDRVQPVTMSLPSRSNEVLVAEINRLLNAKNIQSHTYHANEQKLKQTISNISHDMRTPLTAILGYIHLINHSDISNSDQLNYLRIVENRARSLQNLIENFYELSRLDEGEYPFNNTWVDVNQMCLELIAVLYDDFSNAGLSVDIDLLSVAPKVFTDEKAVYRVFENVFGNVIKYGTEHLIVSSCVENSSLKMTIQNKSTVLTESDIERIFDRTYTTNKSRNNENTGLGLAICKILLNTMGHEVIAAYQDGYFALSVIWNLESTLHHHKE